MTIIRLFTQFALFTLILASYVLPCAAAPMVRSASGASTSDIQASVDAFRADLGSDNGSVSGPISSGRRELSWDGVGDASASPNTISGSYFQTTETKGIVFSTTGTGFQISADSSNPTSTGVRFDNINPDYSATFSTFSSERLFCPIGSVITDLSFYVPGTSSPATITGFGAVFTDVDLSTNASLEFFDATDNSLGEFAVPPGQLSFVGVLYNSGELVSRVRITSGNTSLGEDDDSDSDVDVVALDDFIYTEPIDTPPQSPELDPELDGTITYLSKPTITGLAEPNTTIRVKDNGVTIGTTTADSSGGWSFVPSAALGDNPHTITATALDSTANESEESTSSVLNVLRSPPAPTLSKAGLRVSVTMQTYTARVIYSITARLINNGRRLTVTKISPSESSSIALPQNGRWSFTYSVSDGSTKSRRSHKAAITLS